MALFVAARYARRMGRMGRGVQVAALVVTAWMCGCQSSPSGSPSATPVAARGAALPTALAPVASRPAVDRVPAAEKPARRPTARPPAPPAPAPIAPTAAAIAPPPADDTSASQPAAPYAGIPTAQPPAPRPPRAFRTPERAGDQAFVAPQAGAAGAAGVGTGVDGAPATVPNGAGQQTSSGVVIFRVSASAALEGFDVRVTYPQSLGRFVATADGADCTGAAGASVLGNDTGKGALRLVVASAQALPLPFDAFCRFTIAAGERLDAGAFQITVAEVVLDGKKADPALAVVSVAVR